MENKVGVAMVEAIGIRKEEKDVLIHCGYSMASVDEISIYCTCYLLCFKALRVKKCDLQKESVASKFINVTAMENSFPLFSAFSTR